MQETQESVVTIKPPNYKESIETDQSFYIHFPFYTSEAETTFIRILHRYLGKHDILYLKDMLITVTRELITNAVKANTKRLYFKQNKLDIRNKDDYRKGMESFKDDVYARESDIFEQLIEQNLFVKVIFETYDDRLNITILNNIPIMKEELTKINARIKKAYTYDDIGDAFDDVLDDSEGAGLGLIIALMLFKNSGFPEDAFKIESKNKQTKALISIPKKVNQRQLFRKITKEIMKEVENIPSFPENIMEIQKLCSNPKSTVKEISDRIKLDPGLTTSILKLANSAGFITLNKTKTIEEAVKLIGLKTVNMLLIATGVQEIIDSRYKKFEGIWKNSNRAAFYAQKIALQMKETKLSEFVYLSTLLADIGKIVLLTIEPEITHKIQKIAGMKENLDSHVLEEITLGIDHTTLGSLICKHWKFNEILIKVINFHHSPHMAPVKYKNIVYIVYLAYVFSEIENRKFRFEIVDEDVLEFYNLEDREQFEMLHDVLKKAYSTHYSI